MTSPHVTPTRFTARGPEDLLAVVPVVLGFVPEESVAMLTFGAADAFHARVDLPPPDSDPFEVAAMVDSLLAPALTHAVPRVVFVVYSESPLPAERVGRRLVRRFREAGIEVVEALRADGHRWYPLLHGRRTHPAGVPYDVTGHPFAAQAVLDGRITHASRRDLAATLAPDPDAAAALGALLGPCGGSPEGWVGDGDGDGDGEGEGAWVAATTRRLAAARERADDAAAARLLRAVAHDVETSFPAWASVPRTDAARHVEVWSDLVRRAPGEWVASAASVLAFLAWRAGHGALAWCAVDRADEAAPGHPLALLVAGLLIEAVPPEHWPEGPGLTRPA